MINFMNVTLYRYNRESPEYYSLSVSEGRGAHEKIVIATRRFDTAIQTEEYPFPDKPTLRDLVEKLLVERLEEGFRVLCFYSQSSQLHSVIVETVRNYRDNEVTPHGAPSAGSLGNVSSLSKELANPQVGETQGDVDASPGGGSQNRESTAVQSASSEESTAQSATQSPASQKISQTVPDSSQTRKKTN